MSSNDNDNINENENKINPDILPPPISIDAKPNEIHIRRSPTTKPSSRLSSPSSTRLASPSSTILSSPNSSLHIPFIEKTNQSSHNSNNSSSISNTSLTNDNNSILSELVENNIEVNNNKSNTIYDDMDSNQSSNDPYIINNTNDVEVVVENWKPSYGDIVWVQPHSSLPYWPAYVSDPTMLPFDPHGMTTFLNVTTKYKKYAVYMYASKLWDFAKASQMKCYSEGIKLGYSNQQIDQSTELLFSQAIANANLEVLLESNARVVGVLNNTSTTSVYGDDNTSPSSHSTLTLSTDDGVTADLDQPTLDDSPPIVGNCHSNITNTNEPYNSNTDRDFVDSTDIPINSATCSEASSGILVESDNKDDLSVNGGEMKQIYNPDENMSIIEGSVIEGWEDVDLDLDDDGNIDNVEINKEINNPIESTSPVVKEEVIVVNTEIEINSGIIPRSSYITCDVSDEIIDFELSPQINVTNEEELEVNMRSEGLLGEIVINGNDEASNINQNDNMELNVSNYFISIQYIINL
jgi:hypothetical protein